MARGRARLGIAVGLAASLLGPAAVDAAPNQAPSATAGAYAPGHVLVRYLPSASAAQRGRARTAAAAHDARTLTIVPGLELVDTALPVPEAIRRLEAQPSVLYAEPDYVVHAAYTPHDPRLSELWGMEQKSDVDIDAKAAWDVTNGAGVTVAVVDSGIDRLHPDLAANLWVNPGEAGPLATNGIDDDDDGYVDDVNGWDFVDGDNSPDDEFFHGTHVAGTIAAVGDNNTGVVGVAYGAKVMPLRILDENGDGFVSSAVRAIDYATRHGVRISNNSWGYSGGASQTLEDAIRAAGDAGQLVVVAAGNESTDIDVIPSYPAAYSLPNVLSVAAETQDDQLAFFSNYGASSVDVAAPGEVILSTVPVAGSVDGYEYASGTSMASPHVAGVAALVLAVHPGWSAAQVKDRILRTARPVASLEGLVVSGGMVNAAAAVGSANLAPVVTITAPATGTSVLRGTPVTFSATAVDPEQGNVASSITWVSSVMGEIGTGPSVSRSDLDEGTHVIVAIARDAANHTPLASITLRVGPKVRTIAAGSGLTEPAIAAAPDGTPILAWAEHGVGTVVSRFDGSAWTREVVSAAYRDAWPDVGVEPDGTVRLAIQREWKSPGVYQDDGILVASGDGGGWTTTRASEACGDDVPGCGADILPAWGRDGSGRSHLAFVRVPVAGGVDGNDPGLWHAVEHGDGTWTSERIVAADAGITGPDLATGPSDAVHVAFVRTDAGNEGVYHATNETGSWVVTRVAVLPADAGVGWARVQVSAGDVVDVAWGGPSGVDVRTRTGGTWAAPVAVSPDPAGDVDLARDGSRLHLVFGRTDLSGDPTGIAYATSTGGAWTTAELDTGEDVHPRVAVDGAGNAHVSYLRAGRSPEIRHATNAEGSWATDTVATGWAWGEPAYGVDAAGVRHIAVGRTGTEPGVWYGTDGGGAWTMERLTTNPPDGGVGLAVSPDGTAAILYAEAVDGSGAALADPAVRLVTGGPGDWTTTRIADDTSGGSHAVARDAAGSLHLAYAINSGGRPHIEYATNAGGGGWAYATATTGTIASADRDPSIAVDAVGRAHVAYELAAPGNTSVRYATNATGAWVSSQRAAGPLDDGARIALDPSGHPRIAYWRAGTSHGVRLTSFDGSAWTTKTVSSGAEDRGPSVAVDAAGRTHLLFAGGGLNYDVCQVPLCPSAPGLREWSDAAGFGSPRRVTDFGDDGGATLVLGLDGSIEGAFGDAGGRLVEVRLQLPPATATAPSVHLAGAGVKLSQGKARLKVSFAGTAARYRLQQSVGGGSYATVGSVSSSTSRGLWVEPGSATRQFRVTPYDGSGVAGATVTGSTVRVSAKSERAGSSLKYAGTWARSVSSSYFGGASRHASSSSARATYRFTGRELVWIASTGTTRGKAKVYIDGALASTVNLHASKTGYRRVVYRRAWATSGAHTISIRLVGNGRVDVDGFEVLR